ncbi:MAG: hypothetical protein KUG62_06380 [Rhodobacteraceae bacterium]|nr:hypothetical protein [Paracoccaceae bacterium]
MSEFSLEDRVAKLERDNEALKKDVVTMLSLISANPFADPWERFLEAVDGGLFEMVPDGLFGCLNTCSVSYFSAIQKAKGDSAKKKIAARTLRECQAGCFANHG